MENDNYTHRQEALIENAKKQVENAYKHTNEKSFGTRHAYMESSKRFVTHVASTWSLQNMKNVRNEHIQSYVNELKEDDCTAAYIKTELSGIRHLLHIIGSKNNIYATNDRFGIPKRESEVLPGMTREEYLKARGLAEDKFGAEGRITVDLQYYFGLRINETQAVRVKRFVDATNTGILHLDSCDGTKGGRPRDVKVETIEQLTVIKEALEYKNKQGKSFSDRLLTDRTKGAVHRSKHGYQKMYAENADLLSDKSSHDLRRSFAQSVYDRIPGTDKDKMREVCKSLGHGANRDDITARYVANRWAK